ncbi:GSCFA domain-containing protein [Nisaea sp.]|uniref:GSCFA domain-containing protein n=1 Tax=Nisaea sp. TaxID=2024842 RepID=UPI0032EC5087
MSAKNRPYDSVPPHGWWRRAIADISASDINPALRGDFKITPEARIATAGSCFAQELSKAAAERGYESYVVEKGPLGLSEENRLNFGYGLFSARYGNIYTTRQLVQLLDRAYGRFGSADRAWRGKTGYVDPFRPFIQPEDFISESELLADCEQHLGYVREMFENMDVFVFTLGLTEGWRARSDGATYPLCPGYGAGTFNPEKHEFFNMRVSDVVADLEYVRERLSELNRDAKILLTVSPVPLVATATGKHVLEATAYSKAVLRVAAAEVTAAHPSVSYFPSYEIITGTFSTDRYYSQDRRSVTQEGIDHVMRCFFASYSDTSEPLQERQGAAVENDSRKEQREIIKKDLSSICDEERLLEILASADSAKT